MTRLALAAAAALAILAAGCGHEAPRRVERAAATVLPTQLPWSHGRAFYVATTGSDENPGTGEAPWRTLQKAFDTLEPGEIAYVHGGTYSENLVVDRAGTPDAPITVRNYPGERPVLHPDPEDPSYPLRLTTGAAYLRIRGFVIEDARGPSTMNVVGLGRDPGAHDYEISDCEIRGARNSSGVFVDDTNSGVWLLGNAVHDNNEAGVQHQGIYFEGHDGVIADNVVYHQTDGFGIQVRAGAERVVVANNTVSDVSLSGIMVESSASDVTVVNNVSAFNGGYAVRGLDSGGDLGAGNVAFANLGYGNGEGEFANSNRPVIDFTGDNLVGDPRFADAGAADFRLSGGSPAVGRAEPAWMPRRDRLSLPRPQGDLPDLGAYERPVAP